MGALNHNPVIAERGLFTLTEAHIPPHQTQLGNNRLTSHVREFACTDQRGKGGPSLPQA